MLIPNDQNGAATPTSSASATAPLDVVPSHDADGAVAKPFRKASQKIRLRRVIERLNAEIVELKAELAAARAEPNAPAEDVAALKTERDDLANLLADALVNLDMWRRLHPSKHR